MGRRRREPGGGRTGAAPGDVGPPTETQEGKEENSLGSEVAAENREGGAEEGEEGRKESKRSSYTIQSEQAGKRGARIDTHTHTHTIQVVV